MLYINFCQKEEHLLSNEFLCKSAHKYATRLILHIAKLYKREL